MKIFDLRVLLFFVIISNCPQLSFADSKSFAIYVSGAGNVFIPSDSKITSTDQTIENGLRALGINSFGAEYDVGYGGSIAIGSQIFRSFRLEGEYSYKSADVKNAFSDVQGTATIFSNSGEVEAHSFMLNGFLDLRNASRVTPYIGGGIGASVVETSLQSFSPAPGAMLNGSQTDDTAFAYQILAGVGYWVSSQLIGFLEYKYHGSEELELGTTTRSEFGSHNIALGVRYYFSRP